MNGILQAQAFNHFQALPLLWFDIRKGWVVLCQWWSLKYSREIPSLESNDVCTHIKICFKQCCCGRPKTRKTYNRQVNCDSCSVFLLTIYDTNYYLKQCERWETIRERETCVCFLILCPIFALFNVACLHMNKPG